MPESPQQQVLCPNCKMPIDIEVARCPECRHRRSPIIARSRFEIAKLVVGGAILIVVSPVVIYTSIQSADLEGVGVGIGLLIIPVIAIKSRD